MFRATLAALALSGAVMLSLAGCGGGGSSASAGSSTGTTSSTSSTGSTTSSAPTYTAGVYPAASTFAAQCAVPRTTGTDPSTGRPWPDRAGSALTEKFWLRSWTNDLYLWYSEVPDSDPALTPAVLDYFALLKTPLTTASGSAKDRFHFTYPTDQWIALSQSGSSIGYGISWKIVSSRPTPTTPRRRASRAASKNPAGSNRAVSNPAKASRVTAASRPIASRLQARRPIVSIGRRNVSGRRR